MGRNMIWNSGNEERRPIENLTDAAVAARQGDGAFDLTVMCCVTGRRRDRDRITGSRHRTSARYHVPAWISAAGSAGYQSGALPRPEALPVSVNGEGSRGECAGDGKREREEQQCALNGRRHGFILSPGLWSLNIA